MAQADPRAENMLDKALEYLTLGYPVFAVCSPRMMRHQHGGKPCTSPGKVPLVAWEPFQSRLPTEGEVRSWWGRWPVANIGMATGVLSGAVVLDCDSGDARQLAMERGGLDRTPAVWTGKVGGIHYWLAHPLDEVRNFARRLPGLDFRGDGGYVLLPPSVHASGKEYRWNENTVGMRLAPIPEWLHELLRGEGASEADRGDREAFDVQVVLDGIPEGQRDDTLWRYAGKLRHDDIPIEYAEVLMRQAARLCRPPFDEELAVRNVRRAYREYAAGGSGPVLDFGDDDAEESAGPSLDFGDETGTAAPVPRDDSWKVYPVAEFMAIEYPAVEWRIEGYLRDRAIMMSFGAPGSIKTYVAADASLAIVSGGLFLGRFPTQQGRVLIVQEDTLASDFQQAYLGPMIEARGLTAADLDGLFVAPAADFSLDNNERLRCLCAWLEEYRPDLLVLDSFYLMYSGKREDLIVIMKILKRIRNKYGCAIWVIDHNRKGQGAASSGDDPIDRLINGREKSAAVDVVMESRLVKGQDGSAFLDVVKQRGVKLPETVRVTYENGRITIDGDEPESQSGMTKTVYEWLCREGGSRTKAQMSTGTNLSLRSVEGAVYELQRDGLARKVGKVGRADTWIGIRKSEAEAVPLGPTLLFEEDEE